MGTARLRLATILAVMHLTQALGSTPIVQRVILTSPSTRAVVKCYCDEFWAARGWWCFECENTGFLGPEYLARRLHVEPTEPARSSQQHLIANPKEREAWVTVYGFDGGSTTMKYPCRAPPTVLEVCLQLGLPTNRSQFVRLTDDVVLNIFDPVTLNAAYTVVMTKCPPCAVCAADCDREEREHVLCTHKLTDSGDMHVWHAVHGRVCKVQTPTPDPMRRHVDLQGYVNGGGTELEFTLDELEEEVRKIVPVVFASDTSVADFAARLPVGTFKTAMRRLLRTRQ